MDENRCRACPLTAWCSVAARVDPIAYFEQLARCIRADEARPATGPAAAKLL